MQIRYSEFARWIKKIEKLKNPQPTYIPTLEEIQELVGIAGQKKEKKSVWKEPIKTGRISDYENRQRFVLPKVPGETAIDEKTLYLYLMYLSETVEVPDNDKESKEKLNELNKFLRENLTVK